LENEQFTKVDRQRRRQKQREGKRHATEFNTTQEKPTTNTIVNQPPITTLGQKTRLNYSANQEICKGTSLLNFHG